jgi:phage terminase small subunit
MSTNTHTETPPKPKHRLSQKQLKFIREYSATGNGAEAARTAGYKQGTAIYQQAAENLRKPLIQSEIAKEVAKLAVKITPDRVQRRLDEISHEAQGAGQFGPAVRAEELLGKSIGMWIDQSIQLSGTLQGSHVAALLEVARRRQQEPIDLADDGDGNWKEQDRDERD